MTDKEQLEREIYLLFHENRGAISGVSGYLRRDDSSKLSRQLNPNDDRYSNPFTEGLEILWALRKFAPELESSVWKILEREREGWETNPSGETNAAELFKLLLDKFNEVIFADKYGTSDDKLEKNLYDLKTAVEKKLDFVKNRRGQRTGVLNLG